MCLGAPGFFYCLNLVFLFRYETDCAKMLPMMNCCRTTGRICRSARPAVFMPFSLKSKRTVCIPLRQNEINEGSRSLLPVCKSAAIFRHKAIGITVGLNFVKILQFFFVFCQSSVIIGTFQGEDVE